MTVIPDWLETSIRTEYLPAATAVPDSPTDPPEETEERRALLTAVTEAKSMFTMVELGAGFGRWIVYAAAALRAHNPGCRYRLVAVEAEPTHFAWMKQHTRDNGVPRVGRRGSCKLVYAAVSGRRGSDSFYIGAPNEWYGQALRRPYNSSADADTVTVKTVRLSDLLPRGRVDLIDADIQGAEDEVFAEAADCLHRVRRVYVETHSAEAHRNLKELFGGLGWMLASEAELGETITTPAGTAELTGGGYQSWLNPTQPHTRC